MLPYMVFPEFQISRGNSNVTPGAQSSRTICNRLAWAIVLTVSISVTWFHFMEEAGFRGAK